MAVAVTSGGVGARLLDWFGRGWVRFRRWRWYWQALCWLVPIVPFWLFIGARPTEARRKWVLAGFAATVLYVAIGVSNQDPETETNTAKPTAPVSPTAAVTHESRATTTSRNPTSTSTSEDPTTSTSRPAATTTTIPAKLDGPSAVYLLTDSALLRVDPRTGKVKKRLKLDNYWGQIEVTDDAVWAIELAGPLRKLDRVSLRQVSRVDTEERNLVAAAIGDGEVWVNNATTNQMLRLGPSADFAAEMVPEPFGEDTIVFGDSRDGGLDYAAGHRTYGRIYGPAGNRSFAQFMLPERYTVFGAAFRDGRLWAPGDDGSVGVFDVTTGKQIATVPNVAPDVLPNITSTPAGMWVRGEGDVLRLVNPSTFGIIRTFEHLPGLILDGTTTEVWLTQEKGDVRVAVRVDAETGEIMRTFKPASGESVKDLRLG